MAAFSSYVPKTRRTPSRCENYNCACGRFLEGSCGELVDVYDNTKLRIRRFCGWGRQDNDTIRCAVCLHWMCGKSVQGLGHSLAVEVCRRCASGVHDYLVQACEKDICLTYRLFPRTRDQFTQTDFLEDSSCLVNCTTCGFVHYNGLVFTTLMDGHFPYTSEHIDFNQWPEDSKYLNDRPFGQLDGNESDDFDILTRYARTHVPELAQFLRGFVEYAQKEQTLAQVEQLQRETAKRITPSSPVYSPSSPKRSASCSSTALLLRTSGCVIPY